LQRVGGDPAGLSAREALGMATRGGASVLGRDDIGQLAPGMAADLAAYRLDAIGYAGGLHDPVAALVFCRPQNADMVIVQGRAVVQDGHLTTVDEAALIAEHNRRSLALVRGD
jgi:cytosine/adenosine deaminase-related metal-dependent hydrolase